MAQSLVIDAAGLDGTGFDISTYFVDYFSGLTSGSGAFYGGTPDSAFGGTYYMNGSQHLRSYTDGTDAVAQGVLLEGANIAYDFIHYGAHMGHGITGYIDSMTFGNWVDGVTTGTQGIGAAGEVTGYEAEVVIEGLDLMAAPGSGNDAAANPVYALYKSVQDMQPAAIVELLSDHELEVTGSNTTDKLVGFGEDDVLIGRAGDDVLNGKSGDDVLIGGSGDDKIIGLRGADIALGGLGDDFLNGGRGDDVLKGGAGDDTLKGSFGSDSLTGGAGADTFVIDMSSASDTITDFDGAEDLIDVTGLGVSSVSDFTVSEIASATVLTSGDVDIILNGVAEADLDDAWFVF